WGFSRRGYLRFAEWMTAMATNVEEHTITQSVLALQRPFDWKAMESFAEYSTWRTNRVTPVRSTWLRRPQAGSGMVIVSRPSMTPRSTAAVLMSGAPARSTSTPPAAPTGPPP